ncbi:MAG: hypothetical protein AAF489_15820 [Bacteroidota bacterium]
MKQKDSLEQLFDRLEGTFDVHETPANHQRRFLEKLNANRPEAKRKSKLWRPLSIAATIVLLICAGIFLQTDDTEAEGLASVSPEMEQTQSFFTTAINQELETLKSFDDADTKVLIEDTLMRLEILESDYDQLKIDLVASGNDKRVIAAMITNFQNRIELLQQVIENIEEIKTLKANRNETII